ncbi:tripartite tricarboxylate transporter substrate binding protein [Limnohabitans sp. MMS-10A-178]|jgi:tripartite-type tricarboxylate transporter receptor subunit TctC|uniref:Bug family tripartite tricarboxylate transporter substrate binding protein n=1 Tax=Limnohabitans sp. MMS-10A-178 TaxID=1835767 RepID=UPI001E47CB6A|nr:tripartite tricarboxylate transporter substrate binding protein [Limnohabitans sp. MMS-10A-178]
MAQDWPNKPIRLVINFAPGSSPDVLGRAVATPLSQALGVPVVVENRSGAGGLIGADLVAKAPGDGYTILMASGSTMVVVPTLTPKMPYDHNKALVPVAATARLELFLVVRSNSGFNSFADLQKFARANPGKLSYGSPGNGSTPHIGAEMLKNMAGIFALHIPYRGSAPALQDLLAGNIDFFMDPGIATPHIRSGALRLLAVGSTKRSFLYPDTPTLAELGLKGYDGGSTHSFYAPAGTPQAVIDRLNSEINRILVTPAVTQTIRGLGAEPTPMSPAQLTALNAADTARFANIIKQQGIRAE